MIALIPLEGLPEIDEGDDIGALVASAIELRDGDVVVVSQKIVSKAEGAVVALAVDDDVDAAGARRALARSEAVRVVVETPQVLIVETAHGLVCANAGVDASNTRGAMTLLPRDPDASAARIRDTIRRAAGVDVAVVIADTFGRPWRVGQTDVAIGVSGIAPVRDERGTRDRDGRMLDVTEIAIADELAAAADLVRTKPAGIPVTVVRGVAFSTDDGATARRLTRPPADDLFRTGRGMLAATVAAGGRAPREGMRGVTARDLDVLHAIAGDVTVVDAGPPTQLRMRDTFRAGLVIAALVDLDYDVTWNLEGEVHVMASSAVSEAEGHR